MESWDGVNEFVAVVEAGSFVQAAEKLGVSTAHVSRAVAALEKRLNARLLYRTTRKISLTELGVTVFQGCQRLIGERNRIFAGVAQSEALVGHLNITCPIDYGKMFVSPIIWEFLEIHKDVTINLIMTNDVIDLIGKGIDIAIRALHMPDSGYVQTKIDNRIIHLCASPDYLAAHGKPRHIKDLAKHHCLISVDKRWTFRVDGRKIVIRPKGRWHCNYGMAVIEAAISGKGICRLPDFHVEEYLRTGQLISLLPECQSYDDHIWAIYPQKDYVHPLVRTVIDYLRINIPLHRRLHKGEDPDAVAA